ncbi:hypothetical protein ACFPIJ_39620 [Dactylosporangium cerinum]|uniref:HEAT repeat domain-containing protein n=1 Tax=Dactylosporangium cerinum TaxID=1434730 RepID=A0ABV9W6L7_9ACTN
MDAATLTGQLRRGRGLGLRRAQADAGPGAASAVYGCIIDDPREDKQSESRDWYLLRLVAGLRLDCGPIVAHLLTPVREADDDEWRISLAVDVLAALARDGDARAADGLRRYVAEGRYWAWALNAMWEECGPTMCAGLGAVALARADDEELARTAAEDWGPWSAWAEDEPRIRAVLDARRRARGAPRESPSLLAVPSDQLAATVGRDGVAAVRAALAELGRRGDPVVLDLAEDVSLRNRYGPPSGTGAAIRALGAAALDRARRWAGGDDPVLVYVAEGILALHGTAVDVPVLLAALTRAAEEREWCAAETPARGLGRLGVAAAVPTLRFLWAETTHSYARGDYLAGLVGAAGSGAADVLDEAADDCEPLVREQAAAG